MKKDLDQIISKYKEYRVSGGSRDTVVSRLHEEGVSILDSMKVVRAVYGINLAEAKKIVTEHPLWREVARPTQSLLEEIMALGPEASYGDWLEVYRFGFPQRGRLHVFANRPLLNKVEALLENARMAAKEAQRNLIQQLAQYPDEVIDVLIVLLSEHDMSLWELIISTLHEIGFPRNARAIPWLIDIAIDPHPVALNAAIATLHDMNSDEVAPYLTAILLNRDDENNEWRDGVIGVCRLLPQKMEWMIACGPSIAYLLAQSDYKPGNEPDKEALLSVLEPLIPSSGSYALPVVYRVALLERESNVGKKAKEILSLFSDPDLRLYRYRLEDL